MSTTTGDSTDLATGTGILFGLLATGAAGVLFFADGLFAALGYGGAIVFAALLVASLGAYE